jgi:hypothetical protein
MLDELKHGGVGSHAEGLPLELGGTDCSGIDAHHSQIVLLCLKFPVASADIKDSDAP